MLVADDHPVNLEVILRQLELLGLSAEIAEDGAAALALWRKAPHAVVLLDLHMPVLDGFGLAKAIRHEEAKRGLPRTGLIAVTADAMKGKDTRCFAAGMDGFVTKPVSIDALARTLVRWMPDLVAMPAPGDTLNGALFDPEALRGSIRRRYYADSLGCAEIRRQRRARYRGAVRGSRRQASCGLRTPAERRSAHGGCDAHG